MVFAAPNHLTYIHDMDLTKAAAHAWEAGCERLVGAQSQAGAWSGTIDGNVTSEAGAIFVRWCIGVAPTQHSYDWIRKLQTPEGMWLEYEGGPVGLSESLEAYIALRLYGDGVDLPHMQIAARRIRDLGGIESSRTFSARLWMAILGLIDWHNLPAFPLEWILLPAWAPGNKNQLGAWARQILPSAALLHSMRARFPVPFEIQELQSGRKPPRLSRSWTLADNGMRTVNRHPVPSIRRKAEQAALDWILNQQESDGLWGGLFFPTFTSMVALGACGYNTSTGALRKAIDGFNDRFVGGPQQTRFPTTVSDVWDTALACQALALNPRFTTETQRARAYLHASSALRTSESVGWSMGCSNQRFPDLDCTAMVLSALVRYPEAVGLRNDGKTWLKENQSRSGGWAAFDGHSGSAVWNKIPVADYGEVADIACADVTGHALVALIHCGESTSTAVRHGTRWLTETQTPRGSWRGRWGLNHVYGTSTAIEALVLSPFAKTTTIRSATSWLQSVQNVDGGWGESPRSDTDPTWIGRGDSTPTQTAWAVSALLASPASDQSSVQRGITYLVENQTEPGVWNDHYPVGTAFPGFLYLRYSLYPVVFPLQAIGRWMIRRTHSELAPTSQLR